MFSIHSDFFFLHFCSIFDTGFFFWLALFEWIYFGDGSLVRGDNRTDRLELSGYSIWRRFFLVCRRYYKHLSDEISHSMLEDVLILTVIYYRLCKVNRIDADGVKWFNVSLERPIIELIKYFIVIEFPLDIVLSHEKTPPVLISMSIIYLCNFSLLQEGGLEECSFNINVHATISCLENESIFYVWSFALCYYRMWTYVCTYVCMLMNVFKFMHWNMITSIPKRIHI